MSGGDFDDDRPNVTPQARQLGDGGRRGTAVHVEPGGRIPPQDLDAEAAVLSAILLEQDALDRVVDVLAPEHFYAEANRRIFEAAIALSSKGTPVDIVSVAGELRDRDRLAQIGGAKYLAELADAVPAVAHLQTYALMVKEKWRIRELIRVCQGIAARGYGDVGEVQEFIDDAERAVYMLARERRVTSMRKLGEWVEQGFGEVRAAANRGERIMGVATGYGRLDAKMAGLHRGELTIVAARPGMGKSALVVNMGMNVAAPPLSTPEIIHGVVGFSLEMPGRQVGIRAVCAGARVDLGKLRSGYLSHQDWSRITPECNRLGSLPFWLDDAGSIGVLELRARVRRIQAEFDRPVVPAGDGTAGAPAQRISMVLIDYLQLMKANAKAKNREQEISGITRELKEMAKELDVPVVALSQLNRAVDTRGTKDRRPQLSDLRESGAIEQDADNIIFIYRPDYYDIADQPGIAELIIAKQRNGATGRVKVRFAHPFASFDNLAQYEFEEEEDQSDRRHP